MWWKFWCGVGGRRWSDGNVVRCRKKLSREMELTITQKGSQIMLGEFFLSLIFMI